MDLAIPFDGMDHLEWNTPGDQVGVSRWRDIDDAFRAVNPQDYISTLFAVHSNPLFHVWIVHAFIRRLRLRGFVVSMRASASLIATCEEFSELGPGNKS